LTSGRSKPLLAGMSRKFSGAPDAWRPTVLPQALTGTIDPRLWIRRTTRGRELPGIPDGGDKARRSTTSPFLKMPVAASAVCKYGGEAECGRHWVGMRDLCYSPEPENVDCYAHLRRFRTSTPSAPTTADHVPGSGVATTLKPTGSLRIV
jgi:hypothetical protein